MGWGSIAFTTPMMDKLIGFGEPRFKAEDSSETGAISIEGLIFDGFEPELNPSNLCVGVWLSFVPYSLKDVAREAVEAVWPKFHHLLVNEKTKAEFISALQDHLRVRAAFGGTKILGDYE